MRCCGQAQHAQRGKQEADRNKWLRCQGIATGKPLLRTHDLWRHQGAGREWEQGRPPSLWAQHSQGKAGEGHGDPDLHTPAGPSSAPNWSSTGEGGSEVLKSAAGGRVSRRKALGSEAPQPGLQTQATPWGVGRSKGQPSRC